MACNGRTAQSKAPEPSSQPQAAAKTPAPAVTLPDDVWRGVCFAHSWERGGNKGYGSDESGEALDHLATVGVDWISVTPFGFMRDITDLEVQGEHSQKGPPGAETRERIVQVVEQAKSRNMNVMLKPHIWIHGGKWRGRIKPTTAQGKLDWKTWWDSHDEWIMYYARVAEELKIASLVIGLELHTAVKAHPERLIGLAKKVREVYDGHVTYSANWNEPVPVSVWQALDSVGVQFYPPLAKTRGVFDEPAVRSKLRVRLDEWAAMADRAAKPLIITEVGYRSAEIAVSHPNAWPEKMKADLDQQMQERAYQVFFSELARTPQLKGVFLWKYFTNAQTDEEGPTGFSPRGKPAESVIRRAFD